MIQTNVEMLKNINWNALTNSLTVRSTPELEIVGYLNMMVEQSTGEILEVLDGVREYDNMKVVHIKLINPGSPLSFKLELMDEDGKLSDSIRGDIMSALDRFNKSKQ